MSIWLASSDSPTCAGRTLLQPGFRLSLARQAKPRGVCRGRREAEKREELSWLALGCLACDGPESCTLACPLQLCPPPSQLHPSLG